MIIAPHSTTEELGRLEKRVEKKTPNPSSQTTPGYGRIGKNQEGGGEIGWGVREYD